MHLLTYQSQANARKGPIRSLETASSHSELHGGRSAVQCARQQAQARLTGTASTDPDAGHDEEPPGPDKAAGQHLHPGTSHCQPNQTPANPVTKSQTFRAAPPTAESKKDTPKMGTRQREDPNIWIPRSIKQERSQHPNSQAQGKPRRSLMQPQRRAAGHPFFPTLNE
jgi:hypothetical protein